MYGEVWRENEGDDIRETRLDVFYAFMLELVQHFFGRGKVN